MDASLKAAVTDAYRWILGRDPDEGGLAHQVAALQAGAMDLAGLRRILIESPEFAARNGGMAIGAFAALLREPPLHVEHEVDAATLAVMSDRVRRQWTRLGEEEPHWSVLTDDAFRQDRLDDRALGDFRNSGAQDADLIDIFEARAGERVRRGVCVELGCGVGRVTRFLAERFERVIAVDISPGNLALCRSYMDEMGLTNVETVQISGVEDLAALPAYDLLFSTIVIQHNPPPIQKAILRSLLPKAGAALFQIPASMPGYAFRVADHLAAEETDMDMHCLPRAVVLGEIAAAGLRTVDVCPDNFTGLPGSFSYFAVRT